MIKNDSSLGGAKKKQNAPVFIKCAQKNAPIPQMGRICPKVEGAL